MLYGNDPLAPYPLVDTAMTTTAPVAAVPRNPNMNNLIIKRAYPAVETIFSVPAYESDYFRNNDHWTLKKQQQQPYQQTNLAISKPLQLSKNTFTNQFHELQYRNVRNNYLKHRGYGYY